MFYPACSARYCARVLAVAAFCTTVAIAAPVWAQSETNPPPTEAPPPALTVTGQGESNIAPIGFYLNVTFYNDAVGSETAVAQNEQAEARLREAAVRAGVKLASINLPNPRAVGAPANNSVYGPSVINTATPLKPTDTVRALRSLSLSANPRLLGPLVQSLRNVGVTGIITISYDYGENKGLRNQLLKKAVANAVEQVKIMETAALPRHLSLIAIEQSEFTAPHNMQTLNLIVDKGVTQTAISAPEGYAEQSVTLRYELTDAPAATVAKSAPPAKPAVKPTNAKPAPQKK